MLRYFIVCFVHLVSISPLFSLAPSYAKTEITPQQFGAMGDGIHDDTEAIQSALNCKGKVFLPSGVYKISGKLTIFSGTVFYGEKGSCIKQTKDSFILANEHAQVLNAHWDTNITVKSIFFDESQVDAKSEYTAGLYICGVRNLTVDGCYLNEIGGDGIYLGRGGEDRQCEEIHISNSVFSNCGRNSSNPRQSIAVVFAENVYITNCTMRNRRKASYGVDVEPNNAGEHCSVVVDNCRMIGCGISCGGNNAAKRKITVTNCSIDCSGTENATLSVVKADAQIMNNTIVSNGQKNGITIVTSPSASVKKNRIRDAAAGVLITDGSDNVLVKGNKIVNCSSGVYVIKSRGSAILSNTFSSRGKGIYVRLESSDARVAGKMIKTETRQDIYSAEAPDLRVRRNKKIDGTEN